MNHELWQCNTIYAYRNRCELRIRLTKFSSTTVENPLQINLFMQNKPNLVRRRRIANELKHLLHNGIQKSNRLQAEKKQTQFKPNQTQLPKR